MDVYPAAECPVALEQRAEQLLRLRPACPLGSVSTRGAVRALLQKAEGAREARVHLGRLVEHPWLSALLAREASASRVWDAGAGQAHGASREQYVARALRAMPEFTALFEPWQVASVSTEKALVTRAAELPLAAGAPVAPDARLPYDAIVFVSLRR